MNVTAFLEHFNLLRSNVLYEVGSQKILAETATGLTLGTNYY
jgi:hypothetical protein